MFDVWAARVASAADDEARRGLLAEIAVARAKSLGDVPSTREATWAMAELYKQLGDANKAATEAQQLASLCRTAPRASKGQQRAAEELMSSLGLSAPTFSPPSSSGRDRSKKTKAGKKGADKGRRDDPLAAARGAAAEGQTRNVRSAAGDRRGPTWGGFRAWSLLADARRDHGDDAAALRRAVDAAMGELAAGLGIKVHEPDPLSELMGEPLPSKRRAAIAALHGFADAHPERLAELANTAIDHHLEVHGNGSAGWLSGLIGRALSQGLDEVKDHLAEVVRKPGFRMYDAWAFHRAIRVATAAVDEGWRFAGLREGVLHREEPDDRRVWTLRLARDGGDKMLAIAPHATAPWPDGVADKLGQRLARLSRAALLVASGAGNAALRDAAQAAGVSVLDEDADDPTLLAALSEVEARAEPPPAPRSTAGEASQPAAPAEPSGPSAPEELTNLLTGDEAPTVEALLEVLKRFRRPGAALRVAERAEAPLHRSPQLLRAVHQVEEPDRALPEGTTLLVRAAAHGVDGARELLADEGLAARYRVEGIDVLIELAAALVADGWEIFRVLQGPTRREQSAHPALETLSDGLSGLLRLLVRRGEVKGEVWYVASLPPEGRAGVPQLLLSDHQRAVVLPIDPDLLSWYGGLSGPPAIGWDDAGAEAVKAALQAWSE